MLILDYQATHFSFLEYDDNNSFDHKAKVDGVLILGKSRLNLSTTYQHLTGADASIGQFASRDVTAANLAWDYELGSKTHLNTSATYSGSFYTALQTNQDLMARVGLNYQIAGKTTLGLAAGVGILETETSTELSTAQQSAASQSASAQLAVQQAAALEALLAQNAAQLAALQQAQATPEVIKQTQAAQKAAVDAYTKQAAADQKAAQSSAAKTAADKAVTARQFYKQLLLTASYEATGKLVISANAGMDFREYEGEAAVEDSSNFTFGLTGRYQLRDKTSVSLNASRNTVGSATDTGTAIDRTSFTTSIDQKIGSKFNVQLSGGYDVGDYQAIRVDVTTDRQDKYWFYRGQLNYKFKPWANLGVYYEFRNQNSPGSELTFDNNRLGFQFILSF
jgi:hypothetical protein